MKRIIAARQDGICSRLGAILNAMYVAKKTGKDFYYYWPESEEQMKLWENIKNKNNFRSLECELEKNIFSKNFIQNYSLGDTFQNPGLPYGLKQPSSSFKTTLAKLAPKNEDCFISHVPCYSYIEDIDREEYYREMKAFWRQIEFTSKIQEVIQTAKAEADKLGDFVAVHVRIADVALNQAYKNTGYFVYKFSPLELVFEIIRREIGEYNIVLFSDDFDGMKVLKNYCLENNFEKVYLIDEFMKINLDNETKRALFEVSFMTCAKKIYTGDSNFSKFASRVGLGREATYISEIFSNQERYDLILKNKDDRFNLKPLQDAYKFLYLYTRGKLIKRPWIELEQILVQALALDPSNNLYKIGILECLLNQKKYLHAEKYAKKIIKDDNFLKDLLHPMMIFKDSFFKILSSVEIQYENLYLLYLTMSKKFNLKIKGAPDRIKKHLAYKLGQAMVENSKSILGYIRIPFALMKIYIRYNKDQKTYHMLTNVNPNLLLPKLKEYADYKEALKLKEHLPYKLGEALIKANRNWYGGGYIKLWFEIRKLKKEVKNNFKNQ